MTGGQIHDMYRLLALAKYDERYVIPTAHAEQAHALEELATECALDYEGGPGMSEWGPFGESSGGVTPIAVENFQMLKQRQTADAVTPMAGRVNLLNWDAKGGTEGLFPPKPGAERPEDERPDERAAETVPRPQGPTDSAGPTGSGERS